MNLKSIIGMMYPTSFWRMDKTSLNTNVFDDYDNYPLINYGCALQQDGSVNVNLSPKSTNLSGGYMESNDYGLSNDLLSSNSIHVSFNFKTDTEILGVHPIVSKWFPENQFFVGFENGILVAKLQTDSTLHELYIDNTDVIYNGRWNHVSFRMYNGNIELHLNGHSQDDHGLTSMIISGTTVIGINSPFRIGGDGSYTFAQDFFVSDVALTKSYYNIHDIRPLYILTRDIEERYLDLAPEYYFNISEGVQRNTNGGIANKGTKGSEIKGYLMGADISEFTIRNDSNFYPKKMINIPQNGYFSIDDDIEINLSGVNSATLMLNGSYSKINSNTTQNYLYPMVFGNDGNVWHYNQFFYSYNNDPRYNTGGYDENGDQLTSNTYISQSNLAGQWNKITQRCFRMGSQGTPTEGFYPAEYNSNYGNYSFPVAPTGYNPPSNQNFTSNQFWLNKLNGDYENACLSELALFNRYVSPLEEQELTYPEPLALLYMYINRYYVDWKSCITDTYETIRRYSNINTSYRIDYTINYSTELQHSDPSTNKVNNWTGAVYLANTGKYMRSHTSVKYWSSDNFFQSIFIHNLNTTSAYEFIRWTDNNQTTKHVTVSINQRNGVYSLGDIEVKFDRYYFGSFSTSSQKIRNDGYHMIAIVRNGVIWELWIDGQLEESYITPEVFNVTASYNMVRVQGGECYVADYLFHKTLSNYQAMIEYLFQGFHTRVTGTTYLSGTPIESALHTLNSETLSKLQTTVTDSNGNFNFKLSKTADSSGKYLMALPIDENATSNVVVHGPYQTSVTFDQIEQEDTQFEIYDIIQDMEPYAYYPYNDDVRDPILDVALAGNSYDGIIDSGTDYQLEQTAMEANSTAIYFGVTGNAPVNLDSRFSTDLNMANGFTFSAWVKPIGTNNDFGLFSLITNTYTDQFGFGWLNDQLYCKINIGNSRYNYIAPKKVPYGIWTMVTLRITPDPNKQLEMLENGEVIYSINTFEYPLSKSRTTVNRLGYFYVYSGNSIYIKDGKVSQNAFYDYPVPDEDLQKQAKRGYGYNATTLRSLILSDNPVAYYTFDRLKTVTDEMGNYDLTVNGYVDYTKNSVLINKDIVGNNFLYNDMFHIDPVTNNGTIEFNFKTTGSHTQSVILSEWDSSTGSGSYKFQLEGSNVLKLYVLDDYHYIAGTFNLNEFNFVVLVITNSGRTFTMYINNIQIGQLTLQPLTSSIPYVDVVNGNSPIAYYRLGEISGAKDETGNYNGTLVGSPTVGVSGLLYGNSNDAMSFDGIDDQITLGNEIQLGNDFSISFLCNIKAFLTYNVIAMNSGYGLYFHNDKVSFYYSGSDHEFGSSLSLNTDYNIVIVCESGISKIYVDGVLDNNFGVYNPNFNIKYLFGNNTNTELLNSTIDEFSIYDKALNQGDVDSLYTSSVAPTYQDTVKGFSPLAYYRLGEDSGTIASDETGNHNGTYLNTPTLGVSGLLTNDSNTAIDVVSNQAIDTGILLSASANRTWGCLIKPSNITPQQYILSDFEPSGIANSSTRLTLGLYNSKWYFIVGDDTLSYVDNTIAHNLVNDTTYHLIVVQDGLDYKIYIDSVLVHTFTSTVDATIVVGAYTYHFGRLGDYDNVGYGFDGTIDEPFIIDSSLTQSDITYLYQIGTSTQSYDYETKALNPIGYWRLGETGGTLAVDEMGTFNGTYTNSPTLGEPGLLVNDVNDSIKLDGVNQYASLTPTTNDTSSPVSVMFLCNLDSTKSGFSTIMDLGGQFGGKRIDVSGGEINIYTVSEANVTTPMTFDETVHVCCVWDNPNNTRYIYINGIEAVNGSLNSNSGNYGLFTIGGHLANGYYMKGTLDEVALYDKALTPTEINNLYQISLVGKNSVTPQYTPYQNVVNALTPLAYYRLGDDPTIAFDETGNYNGTYVNSPILGTQGLLTNDVNTAVTFDGSTQSINTGLIYTASANRTWSILLNCVDVTTLQYIFSDFSSAYDNNESIFSFGLYLSKWYFSVGDGSSNYFNNDIAHNLVNDTTYHLTIVQIDLDYKLYIDSVLVHTFTSTVDTTTIDGVFEVFIGKGGDSSNGYFDGTLDEPFISNSSLTQNDINDLYKSSKNIGEGDGNPVYGLNRMTIGSDSQGSDLGQLASPTWIDDVAFYNSELIVTRQNTQYDQFLLKKSTLINDL